MRIPLVFDGYGRRCGECTVCCTVMGVVEVDTEAWEACQHVCESGCGIYSSRPVVCSMFSCLWLSGAFQDSYRPDKLGLMFTSSLQNNQTVIQCMESRKGALQDQKAFYLLDQLSQRYIVLIQHFGQRTGCQAMGPTHLIKQIGKISEIRK